MQASSKPPSMKTFIIAVLGILLFSITASAQESKMIKLDPGFSYKFKVDEKRISGKEAKQLISTDPEAAYSFQSARQNKTVSHLFAGIGAAGLAYSIVAFVDGDIDTKWGIFAGSVALIGFAVPLYTSADRQMCGALQQYNEQFMDETSYYQKPKKSITFKVSGNGAGVVFSY